MHSGPFPRIAEGGTVCFLDDAGGERRCSPGCGINECPVAWKASIAIPGKGPDDLVMAQKVCPVVIRRSEGVAELLAFRHPSAGNQFVKGGIEEGETAPDAAIRELDEESGITAVNGLVDLGEASIGPMVWHFFSLRAEGLPDRWEHQTRDDFGHLFSFFWHPLAEDLGEDWHSDFHEALEVIRRSLPH